MLSASDTEAERAYILDLRIPDRFEWNERREQGSTQRIVYLWKVTRNPFQLIGLSISEHTVFVSFSARLGDKIPMTRGMAHSP